MKDILLKDNYQFDTEGGDFKVGDSEGQHIRLLFDTAKGDWTQSPLTGIGAVKWQNGVLDARFEREVQLQLEADGLTNFAVDVKDKDIFIFQK